MRLWRGPRVKAGAIPNQEGDPVDPLSPEPFFTQEGNEGHARRIEFKRMRNIDCSKMRLA